MNRNILIGLAVAFLASAAFAAEAPPVTLKVGDPAPKLQASKWVKGDEIKELEKGKIYVMEFWATWCGPCRASIPHVTTLQAKYKDKGVVVIGMNIWERDLSLVEPFVKEMGDKMNYTVAMEVKDGARGLMADTWMAAAGRNGIPCSFIVDRDGKIAWIGHPMTMDRPLGLIVEGKFDAMKEAERDRKITELNKQINDAMRAKEFDKALGVVDQQDQLDPAGANDRMGMRLTILVNKQDAAAVNALVAKWMEGELAKDQMMMARVAYYLSSTPLAEKLDGDLLFKVALRAVEIGGDNTTLAKSALARVYAARKQYDKAVEIQTEVVEKTTGPAKQNEQRVLDQYKQKVGAK